MRKSEAAARVTVENINHPCRTTIVDKARYEAMRRAMLKVIPKRPPGLTPDHIYEAVLPILPSAEFPGGDGAGWWCKCVQLDLEAKGLIFRDPRVRPLRLTRV